ncbi:hypothetical protein HNV23_08880 [Bacillus paranthracis]|uniref:hypothetical protein n=1 Tax=Bacillus paranthracis TaxID=2026186 RepID=UPI00148F0068|nr:hypothetical protein [Bacillus paranthracis]NOP79598.1 hypothetical protein [Bacillus paranthracis]
MDEKIKATLLELFKTDLGISHNLRDAYFSRLIASCKQEIERLGVVLDLWNDDDLMLLVDYSLWTYRKRQENVPLSRNLQLRINNRIVRMEAKQDAVD